MADKTLEPHEGRYLKAASRESGPPEKKAKVAAIVLAAGLASRFGRQKLLAPVGDRPMLECTLDTLRASTVDKIVLVLGHLSDEVLRSVSTNGVRVVLNPEYREGMSSSLRAGIRALEGDEDAVLVVLGDQPLLRAETIDAMRRAYEEAGVQAVIPVHRGQRGNPVLLDLALRNRMEAIRGDMGCRELLKELDDVLALEVDDLGVIIDIDTEDDLDRALKVISGSGGDAKDGR